MYPSMDPNITLLLKTKPGSQTGLSTQACDLSAVLHCPPQIETHNSKMSRMGEGCPEQVGIRNRLSIVKKLKNKKGLTSEGAVNLMNEVDILKKANQCLCTLGGGLIYCSSICILSNWGILGFCR